jgi:hypothetical protein
MRRRRTVMTTEYRWSVARVKQAKAIKELIAEGYTATQIWGIEEDGSDAIAEQYHPCGTKNCGTCGGAYCADWIEWKDSEGYIHYGYRPAEEEDDDY